MRKITVLAMAAGTAALLSFGSVQAAPVTPMGVLPLLEQGTGIDNAQYTRPHHYYRCWWVYRRVWTGYSWYVRRARVCGW